MAKKALSGMHITRLKHRSWRTKAGLLLVLASIISGFMTYAALTETPPFGDNPDLVITLLNIDLIILFLLVILITRRIISVWSSKKKGIAGSNLHIKLVYVFSILVAVPTIVMTVFSAFFFHFGVQTWFSQRVQTAIHESQAVAESYLEEHKQVIRSDTLAMASDIDRQADRLLLDETAFSQMVDTQSFFRNLAEAIVINQNGRVLARSSLSFSLEYELPPRYAFQQADRGDAILMMGGNGQDRVRALVKLSNIPNTYLYVGRMIDPDVLRHLNAAKLAIEDYDALRAKYSGLQITVTLIFVVVGMLLLLAAIWSGLLLARQLVNPISELITAADRVRAGDFTSRVPDTKRLEEFEYLALSFNKMTRKIQNQRNELIDANRQIDSRRRLTETVLAGVSSGVIGVNEKGTVNLANSAASKLLSIDIENITDQYILDIVPELKSILESVTARSKKVLQQEASVISPKGEKRTFLFNVVVEQLDDGKAGLIITFDDITDLQSAQRKAAWSDVARRIAHEIKNPLTPIQLSAERLKRKYGKNIEGDQETFAQMTDTIIKHVKDIGRMVDEFSSFARMPDPILKAENLSDQMEEDLRLFEQAHNKISFCMNTESSDIFVNMDTRQIRQVMNNLLQNAVDSISMSDQKNAGAIDITIGQHEDEAFVSIQDNGIGFPKNEETAKLADPYVTHKPKGTGLGLAIVKKIMDDHGGQLILGTPGWLESQDSSIGATVTLTFPTLHIDNNSRDMKNYA